MSFFSAYAGYQIELHGLVQGSVVVDFSVWTDSNTLAETFSTAIATADLTIASSGAAPTVHVPQVDVAPSTKQQENGDDMNILSTRTSLLQCVLKCPA